MQMFHSPVSNPREQSVSRAAYIVVHTVSVQSLTWHAQPSHLWLLPPSYAMISQSLTNKPLLSSATASSGVSVHRGEDFAETVKSLP